jgi:hypothetical protein
MKHIISLLLDSIKNSRIFRLTYIILLTITCAFSLLACNKANCKFTDDEKNYLYENEKEISFLENGIDTILLKAETTYTIFDETSAIGVPDLYKEEMGTTSLLFNNYRVSIQKRACEEFIRFTLYRIEDNHNNLCFSEDFPLDSIKNEPIMIAGHKYSEYAMLTESSLSKDIKNFYYAKGFGVLKIEMLNGYVLELIP